MSPSNTDQEVAIVVPNGVHGEEPQLKQSLLKQLEYYFSKENLEKDDYLKSQMTADHFVPVSVIAGFTKVRQLTTDVGLIVEVLRTSTSVVVSENGESVRPNLKVQRSTLILRDIPADVPVKDVEAIFQHEGCAPVKNLKSDVANTWFVSFETEGEALDTLLIIRQKTFNGRPVQAGVKSENPLKTLFSTSTPTSAPAPAAVTSTATPVYSGEQYYGNSNNQYWNSQYYDGQAKGSRPASSSSAPREARSAPGGRTSSSRSYRDDYRDSHREPRSSNPRGEPKTSEARTAEASPETKGDSHKSTDAKSRGGDDQKGTPRPPRKSAGSSSSAPVKSSSHPRNEAASGSNTKTKPKVVLGPESFPPLPGAPEAKQEINFALNYSAVAHAVADKPVQNDRQNARKPAAQASESSEKKNESEDAKAEKASEHSSRPPRGGQDRSRSSQHGSRPSAPRGGEKPAARPAEVKEKVQKEAEAEQPPKEVTEGATTESPSEEGEAKDADSTKGKSYAEILRMKAALKEQAKPAANGAAAESSSSAPAQPKGEKAQSSGSRPPAGGRHPPAQGGASRQRPSNSGSGSGAGAPRPRNAPDHSRHRTRSQNSEDPRQPREPRRREGESAAAAAPARESAPAKEVVPVTQDASAKASITDAPIEVPSTQSNKNNNAESESAAAGSLTSSAEAKQAAETTEAPKTTETAEAQ